MSDGQGTGSEPARESVVEAEARYRQVADDLADGLDAAVTSWIVRVVNRRLPTDWPADRRAWLEPQVDEVAALTHAEVVPRLRELLAADVDAQRSGPLGVLRGCVGPANRLLADAGVPRPKRDPVTESMFPDDPYDLGPANFDDVDPALHDIGLVWGAAKAHVVLIRHRH